MKQSPLFLREEKSSCKRDNVEDTVRWCTTQVMKTDRCKALKKIARVRLCVCARESGRYLTLDIFRIIDYRYDEVENQAKY